MQNYKLFIRSMRVMGKKRFVYLGSIFVMSVTFALFGIMSSLLMKCVVDIAQTGEYERLGYSIAAIVVVGVISLLIYRVATIRYNGFPARRETSSPAPFPATCPTAGSS